MEVGTVVEEKPVASNGEETKELTLEEKKAKVAELFAEGKKHYFAQSLEDACRVLSDACKLSDELFGELSAECYEPFFFCGRALLDWAQIEDKVIDHAMTGMPLPKTTDSGSSAANDSIDEEKYENPDKVSEEEREKIREEVGEALAEGAAEKAEELETEKKTEGDQQKDEKVEDAGKDADGGEEESEGEDEEMDEEGDGEEAQATTTMQDAWEYLEVARAICDKFLAESDDWKHRKINTLLFLAECSIGDEQYEQALSDLDVCLELQKAVATDFSTDRVVAQTYFTIARAHKLNDNFDDAARHFDMARDILKAKIENLEKELNSAEEVTRKQTESAIEEMKSIISDLDLKKQDAEDSAKIRKQVEDMSRKVMKEMADQMAAIGEDKPVNDITMNLRKPAKRPAGDDAEVVETEAKKAKEAGKQEEEKEGHVSPAPEN